MAIQANARGQRNAYSTDLLTKAALNAIRIYKPDWYKHYRRSSFTYPTLPLTRTINLPKGR